MGIFCVNGYFIVYLNDLYISERFVYVDTLMACLDILEAHFIVLYN